ncbi:helix-turn-helix domain-containing protein [Nocardioides sp. R-C-SC26]|uniref:winged helix-turn-helix transcriptional regulator n=1 Tax=Nocardioides sp. R-C-SC26 TaxID=2870414 RepID=UPI001E2FC555|nr:helix-turn-helix domain-containing protein [Nocardioides sp. R-C-SC26]
MAPEATATSTDAPPPALSISTENCQIARALEVLGEKGCVVVLREVFNGVRRFADMQRHSGLPRQVLSNRLATLVEHDVLRRVPYREDGARERHEYRLTEKGFDLYPVLAALSDWGTRYYTDADGVPVELVHRDCGAPATAALVCADGHRIDSRRDVVPRPGPGARPFTPS